MKNQLNIKRKGNTALLLFSRSILKEGQTKKYDPTFNLRANSKIANDLIKRSKQLCINTGLDFFHSDEKTQIGKSFGEKISNAIEQVFKLGFEKVIVVGNDCPSLNSRKILLAKEALVNNNFVLGPDKSKGLYLFGIGKSAFDPKAIELLKWKDGRLLNSIKQHADSQGLACFHLNALQDINNASDLKANFFLLNQRTKQLLLILWRELTNDHSQGQLLCPQWIKMVPSLRGPPMIFS